MVSKHVYVESKEGLVEVEAFLDPAVPKSFISDRFFKSLALPSLQIEAVTISLRGKPCQEYYAWIQIYVDGNKFREKCRVLEGFSEDLVLGSPAFARCGPSMLPGTPIYFSMLKSMLPAGCMRPLKML